MSDKDTLPPGWWMSDRGPVSPGGRLYEVILPGYELADLDMMDDLYRAVDAALRAFIADGTEPVFP